MRCGRHACHLGFQAHTKTEAVHGSHRCLVRLNSSKHRASRMRASLRSAFMCCTISPVVSASGSVRLHHKQVGARIRLQVLRMHGHGGDGEDRTPVVVEPVGHHRSEGEPRSFARKVGASACVFSDRCGRHRRSSLRCKQPYWGCTQNSGSRFRNDPTTPTRHAKP
jgi:hypothetical protein